MQFNSMQRPVMGTEVVQLSSDRLIPTTQCLEELLAETVLSKNVNTLAIVPFDDYLVPNEGGCVGVKEHLNKAMRETPGLLVSVGTERSFFNLAQCDPNRCTGLVVIDINPRVKAYVDFNICLLRISKDREEYIRLSSKIMLSETLEQRVSLIEEKLKQSDISSVVIDYYLYHLKEFAKIYYDNNYFCRQKERAGRYTEYWNEDSYFNILQDYAKSGNIVAKVGDIGDLQFLKKTVSVVDVSNIPDYVFLSFNYGKSQPNPLTIWTRPDFRNTRYFSGFFGCLNKEEELEFNKLIDLLKRSPQQTFQETNCLFSGCPEIQNCSVMLGYNQEFLVFLRSRVNRFAIEIPQVGKINFHLVNLKFPGRDHAEAVKRFCEKEEKMKNYLLFMVRCFEQCPIEIYEAFSSTPGWDQQFLEYFKPDKKNFRSAIEYFEQFPNTRAYTLIKSIENPA